MNQAPTRNITLALRGVRAQGLLFDALTGLCLGAACWLVARRASLAVVPPWPLPLGGLLGALCGLRWTQERAARAVEHARPALGSALQALLEGQGGTLRPKLQGWVAARTGPVLLRAGLVRVLAAGALALGASRAPVPEATRVARPLPAVLVQVSARVEPPRYSRLPPVQAEGLLVQALRGSKITLTVRCSCATLALAEEGGPEQELALTRGPAPLEEGTTTLEYLLDQSRGLRLAPRAGAPLLVRLEALPDRPPEVSLLEPAGDLTVHSRPGPLRIRAGARDDLGVASLTLHWTLAHGRGEAMRFQSSRLASKSREVEGGVAAEGTLDPTAAGMTAGDSLVVWAEATDANDFDGPGRARSAARLLRWDEPVALMQAPRGVVRLPPPQSLLSERELLARTERLVRSGARGRKRREAAADLAADQRSLRTSFAFFLQAESGDGLELDMGSKELAEQADPSSRRLLARAVSFMWEAEVELGAGRPAQALAPERAAVKALDEALGGARLSLRPGVPPDRPVDESRRLHGAQKDLHPVLRPPPVERLEAARRATERLAGLARELLLAAEAGVAAQPARALADLLFAMPPSEGFAPALLAAPLYAASSAAGREQAARAAGEALARVARPDPLALPPVALDEGRLLSLAAGVHPE